MSVNNNAIRPYSKPENNSNSNWIEHKHKLYSIVDRNNELIG